MSRFLSHALIVLVLSFACLLLVHSSSMPNVPQTANVIVLDYADLVSGKDMTEQIGEAYGFDGIGLLAVRNIPGLKRARLDLLPLARKFAILDEDIQNKYVHEESFYSFGWSLGKEKLEGKPDLSKGSYYANPQYDEPMNDEAIIKKYPAFVTPNIWPKQEMPEFEHCFKRLGQLIVSVGVLVSQQCDAYIKKQCSTYEDNKLERTIKNSICCKARLLHYYPKDESDLKNDDSSDFSSWCGWHNDHGSLTGLTSALYLNANGDIVENTDDSAGLYIRGRHGELIKAAFPADCVAFQIGETAQIHSGGVLQATPHAVRGSKVPAISRETFAVFMEPNWYESVDVPEGVDVERAQSQTAADSLPAGVPSLASRWKPSQTFGEFAEATINAYY
jgi:isopenicillin N synthase-like dioxygenase